MKAHIESKLGVHDQAIPMRLKMRPLRLDQTMFSLAGELSLSPPAPA